MKIALPIFALEKGVTDEVVIIPFGKNEMVDGSDRFDFTPADAQAVISFFKARGLDFQFDWEHQSIAHLEGFEHFKAPNGQAPAAGWASQLAVGEKGLVAKSIRWTAEAADAIATGKYRYQSPVIVRDQANRVRAVLSVGLTNEPRLKNIPALAARSDLGELLASLEKEKSMLTPEVAGALGVKTDASDHDVLSALTALKNRAAAGDAAAGQVTALKSAADEKGAKVTELETKLADASGKLATATADATKTAGEITALKNQLTETVLLFATETGRITPAAKEQWKGLVEANPAAALTALKSNAAGSALPTGRITGGGGGGANNGADLGAEGAASPHDHVSALKNNPAVDKDRLELHHKALKFQSANPNATYLQAVEAVSAAK